MSQENSRKTKKGVRRSIPVLIPKETGRKGSGSVSSPGEKPSPTAGGDGKQATKPKQISPAETRLSHFREKTDDFPKTRPPLSLQGPFNPNIVGHRKMDDTKRKRFLPRGNEAGNTTILSGVPEKGVSRSQNAVPKFDLFNVTKVEHEEHRPKRNPTQDKKRCSIEFQPKPDTNFGGATERPVSFTAAGKSTNHPQKPHSQARNISSRYMDPWKVERQLKEKVKHFETERDQLTEEFNKGITDLENLLEQKKEETERLRSEKQSLEEVLKDKATQSNVAIEEKTRSLSIQNDTIQEKLRLCQQRLEEVYIDPVNLTLLPSDQPNMHMLRKQATECAGALKEQLAQMDKRNQEIIASLSLEDSKENVCLNSQPLVHRTTTPAVKEVST